MILFGVSDQCEWYGLMSDKFFNYLNDIGAIDGFAKHMGYDIEDPDSGAVQAVVRDIYDEDLFHLADSDPETLNELLENYGLEEQNQ